MTEPSRRPSRDRADAPGNESASIKTRPLPLDDHGLVDVARLVVGEVYTTALGQARFEGLGDDGATAFAELPEAPLTAPERQDRAVVIEGIAARRKATVIGEGGAVPFNDDGDLQQTAYRRSGHWSGWRYTDEQVAAIAAAPGPKVLIPTDKLLAERDTANLSSAELRFRKGLERPPGMMLQPKLVPNTTHQRLERIAREAQRRHFSTERLARALGFKSVTQARQCIADGVPDSLSPELVKLLKCSDVAPNKLDKEVKAVLAKPDPRLASMIWCFRLIEGEVNALDPEPVLRAALLRVFQDDAEDVAEAELEADVPELVVRAALLGGARTKAEAGAEARKRIAEWALAAADWFVRPDPTDEEGRPVVKKIIPDGHVGDRALNAWIATWCGIWKRVTGLEPTVSRTKISKDENKSNKSEVAQGAFLRFLQAALAPTGIAASAERLLNGVLATRSEDR